MVSHEREGSVARGVDQDSPEEWRVPRVERRGQLFCNLGFPSRVGIAVNDPQRYWRVTSRDMSLSKSEQCAPVLVKGRARLTTSDRRLSKFVRSVDPRTFADEAASVGDNNNGAVGRSLLPAMAPVLAGKDLS